MKKTFLVALLSAGAIGFAGGCASPGAPGGLPTIKFPPEKATGENANNVLRNWAYENRMMIDDINFVLMIDEPSGLTKWNVR
jgi:hypothetical protein